MQKRIVIVVFFILAAILAFVIIERNYFSESQKQMTPARLVVPHSQNENTEKSQDKVVLSDNTILTSLITLRTDETLLSIVSMDFDGDGYEDQVNAVKSSSSPYLQLVIGLYNSKTQNYERKTTIETKISQIKTFSHTGIDLIGDHRTSLVYQGILENGNSVLKAYFISNKDENFSLENIADLEGNGTIFIQQVERNESYDRSFARGADYPIWVYSFDESTPEKADQIQTCYKWNSLEKKYVQTQKLRETGSKIAAKELASIQDGTVKTFANFLDGLWYKTETKTGGIRYIFFDYAAKQIIFLMDENEEVYNWQNSSLHYRGMYISTTNLEIENLQRKVNISLLNVDEIRLLIQDDVRMLISEENTWNGDYKKMKFSDLYEKKSEEPDVLKYISALKESTWKSSDGTFLEFADGSYSVNGDVISDAGDFTLLQIVNESFIEFRSLTETPFFKGAYKASYPASVDDKNKEDKDRIILQPHIIKANKTYASDERPIILTRVKETD